MIEVEIRQMFVKAAQTGEVHWGIATNPDAAFPRIHLHMISEEGDHDLDGPVALKAMTVQVDILDNELMMNVLKLKGLLKALDGTDGEGNIRGVFIDRMRMDADTANPESPIHRYSIDFEIHYVEPSE